jgi:phosphatidylinositol-3-phosphatase
MGSLARRRFLLVLGVLGAFVFGAIALSDALSSRTHETATRPCGTRKHPPRVYRHVVWIWMENKPYTSIIGDPRAPYENALARACGLGTNYHGVTHPSLPNYIAATSGSTYGISTDCLPSACRARGRSIFHQTKWATYMESMPGNCWPADAYPYTPRHNPAVYFTLGNCGQASVPLRSGISAPFTFVAPNLCNDTHDCTIETGDAWLADYVPKLLRTRAWRAGRTAIFITWDEDDGSSSNHIPLLVLSPYTKPGTRYSGLSTHYSLLKTTQQMLRLKCLAAACSAPGFRRAFGL